MYTPFYRSISPHISFWSVHRDSYINRPINLPKNYIEIEDYFPSCIAHGFTKTTWFVQLYWLLTTIIDFVKLIFFDMHFTKK